MEMDDQNHVKKRRILLRLSLNKFYFLKSRTYFWALIRNNLNKAYVTNHCKTLSKNFTNCCNSINYI